MSLVASAFDATGQYFASVAVSLNSHTLRVQSCRDAGDNFSNVYPFDKAVRVNSLVWIHVPAESVKSTKLRRLDASLEDQLVALSLDNGSVYIYSPSRNEVIHKITTSSHISSTDFHHNGLSKIAWSCDSQGSLFELDLKSWQVSKTLRPLSEETTLSKLASITYNEQPHLLLGSHSTYLVDPVDNYSIVKTFPGHVSPIHTILSVHDGIIFTAAQGDRFINAISIDKASTLAVFVAEEPVVSLAFAENGFDMSILAATTESGAVEIFNAPLQKHDSSADTASSPFKRKKKVVNTHRSDAKLTVSRPASDLVESLPIQNVTLTPKQLTVTWLEDSSVPFFETLDWWVLSQDSDKEYKQKGDVVVEKPKPVLKFTQFSKFGHDIAASKTYNESHAIISSGDNLRDVDGSDEDEEDEMTLAERLQAIQTSSNGTVSKKSGRATAGTLTTVLSQALKSNDHSLLESVLNNKDETVIRNTILKLDSIYVGTLLDRLAERISRNGNRQTNLVYWIKHILIFHGGALQNSANLSLVATTMRRRAANLDRLLELRGKFSMLTDRLELKREMVGLEERDQDEEDEVEYVEELDDAGLLSSDEDDEESESEEEQDVVDSDQSDDQLSDIEVESNGKQIDISDSEESV
ncbi:hypothetical protein OGAPHI_000983 [Ogataea philodendri]|uniref:Small-subunit processome Utp12 domain-containing protein n=2 Tax=Ogataea TaxID=461281 RepID=A0A9P8PDW8_9ASCO|nr:uncharacterized protein OGAPHI_000983 [Ogataea philodendri]KAH3670468.1 hypothetical protein OGAPHI_000983 [Ogataea philodendri]